jgi:hypothetical protein
MKVAVVYCVPVVTAKRFAWRWRSEDHTQGSTQSFKLYADCEADAKRNGYKVQMGRIEARSDLAAVRFGNLGSP